jgi:hypothetical protein
MSVAAITAGGRPHVSSGSSDATSGKRSGEATPFYSLAPVVTIEIGVTADPVPAVVGASSRGNLGATRLADAIGIGQPFVAAGEHGDEFVHVHGRAAAQTDDALGAKRACGSSCSLDNTLGRIDDDVRADQHLEAGADE